MVEATRKLRSVGALIAVAACLLAGPPAAAQFATHTFWMPAACYSGAQTWCPDGTPQWVVGSGSATGTTTRTCTINDPLPGGVKVVALSARMLATRSSWAGGVPDVTLKVNDKLLGSVQVTAPWSSCPVEYEFPGIRDETGLPGYLQPGSNLLEITVANAYGIYLTGVEFTVEYAYAPGFEGNDSTPESQRRVLLNRFSAHWPRDQYTSLYQRRREVYGNADGKFEIRAHFRDPLWGTSLSNQPVYFGVIDESGHENYGSRPTISPNPAMTDGYGWATVVLSTASDTASGNKYRVVASASPSLMDDPDANCGAACGRSGVIRTMRRMYIQKHQMFRVGSTIIQGGGSAMTHSVRVDDVTQFAVGNHVRLIHAPPLGGGSASEFAWQDNTVADVVREGKGQNTRGTVILQDALEREYGRDSRYDDGTDKFAYLSDGIGVITARGAYTAGDYFQLHTQLVPALFDKAGVEYLTIGEPGAGGSGLIGSNPAVSEIPRLVEPYHDQVSRLLMKWMVTGARDSANWSALANHKAVCAADQERETNNELLFGYNDGGTALTVVYDGRITEWVRRHRRARNLDHGVVAAAVNRETTAHEFTHQFRVNAGRPGWHCDGTIEGDDAGRFCLMNTPGIMSTLDTQTQRWDGVVGWHQSTQSSSGECQVIRQAPEPVLQELDPLHFPPVPPSTP